MPPLPPSPEPRWIFPDPPDAAATGRLERELRLPAALCGILTRRGHADPSAARAFLRPSLDHLHDPAGLAGVASAVSRLRAAIEGRERILVHGDYDVDGICGTALLVRALRMMGAEAVPFVPHRLRDGYDLTGAGVRAARKAGADLILTADCGIVAHDAVASARRSGIDVIVTDHHTPGDALPAGVAVVNPNRADCTYPEKGLAGAAVAWKLCQALASDIGFPEERLHALLDLVAVATVADLAPLSGENRFLVRWGLRILPESPNAGLRALLARTRLDRDSEISAGQVGFVLAPRINAIGRIGEPMLGVRLLLTDDPAEAAGLADELEAHNAERRRVDADTLRQALLLLEQSFDPSRDRGVVLAAEGWHPGVIGIVASRVVERIHRPTVLIALEGDEGRGSARSVPGFHLYDAMHACAGHLSRFGGHRAAAGCSIRADRVEAFTADFDARARLALRERHLTPELRIDLVLDLAAADADLCRLLRHAAPFGMGNSTPTLAVRGVQAMQPSRVGTDHLRVDLCSNGTRLGAIGFGMADRWSPADLADRRVDAAFRLEENVWRGRISLQARLVGLRATAS